MKWKKIFRYLLLLFIIGTVIFAFLAQRDLKKIYGGLTEKVDPSPFQVSSEPVWIKNVSVLSQDCERFIPNQNVLINEGQIVSVDSLGDGSGKFKVIDGQGKYLIPGLIDSHVHLFKSPNDLLLYLANGVTEIREMIGEEDHLQWRAEIQKGRLGPDMYIASPRLGSFGALEGWFMEWSQGFETINDEEEARTFMEKYAQMGYDGVKIYSHLNKESYKAVNKIAPSKDLDIVGHIPWSIELEDLWESNQKELSHLEELMNALRREFGSIKGEEGAAKFLAFVERRSKEIAPQLVAHDIAVTTTLWLTESFVKQKFQLDQVLSEVKLVYVNPGISEWNKRIPQGLGWLPEVNRYKIPNMATLTPEELEKKKIFWTVYAEACQLLLARLNEQGVKILAGTDANLPPTVPGFSLHDELMSMNQAGMSPSQALRACTRAPASWMGRNTGIIKPGYKANLVLLDKNPLNDIRHTTSINTVFINGRVLDRTILDGMLDGVKAANDESRTVDINQYAKN